jgi:4-hydroxy-tetrahydrodipicolinate synthase
MPPDLAGVWVPLVTPLNVVAAVDADALARLGARVLGDGCTGLVALGTTGEPATLRPAERRLVVDVCADVCVAAGKPLMVGVGSNSTEATIDDLGALENTPALTAFLVVVPYYTRPTVAGIIDHYRAIAAAAHVPIVVYNVPYRTGRGLDADALLEVADIPGIVGVKQAVGALDLDTLELLRRKPRDFQVLAGDDAFITPTMLMGGVGAIAASAHVCTDQFVQMIAAARAGDSSTAAALAHALLPVVTAGFAEPNPACWKSALCALGELPTQILRPPMTAASPTATAALLNAIEVARGSALRRPSAASE